MHFISMVAANMILTSVLLKTNVKLRNTDDIGSCSKEQDFCVHWVPKKLSLPTHDK